MYNDKKNSGLPPRANHQGAILTLVDRKSRRFAVAITYIEKLDGKTAKKVVGHIVKMW